MRKEFLRPKSVIKANLKKMNLGKGGRDKILGSGMEGRGSNTSATFSLKNTNVGERVPGWVSAYLAHVRDHGFGKGLET